MDKHGTELRRYSFQELAESTNYFFGGRRLEGACGAVFRGKLRGGKVIAVKRINQEAKLPQLESEVTLKRIEHTNIIRLEGYCFETREAWHDAVSVTERLLCYELPKGRDLDTVLFGNRKQGLDWETRFKIIQGICHGVQYLHEECPDAPIVGLDLNPANIFLDDDMVPKLGDFGHSDRSMFLGKAAKGHMTPEYVNSGIFITKSDIFSLGVLIVEIVTGQKCGSNNRTDHSGRSFVQKVHKTWMENYGILYNHPSLEERFVPTIKSFIKMGLRCVEEKQEERPTIGQIIRFFQYKFTNAEAQEAYWDGASKYQSLEEDPRQSLNSSETLTMIDRPRYYRSHNSSRRSLNFSAMPEAQLKEPAAEEGAKRRRRSERLASFGRSRTPETDAGRRRPVERGTKRQHVEERSGGDGDGDESDEAAQGSSKRRHVERGPMWERIKNQFDDDSD